jgi:hypothetical protein
MQFGTGTRAAVDERLTILHGLQVQREDPVVVGLGDLEERGDVLDPDVVDERVELAEVRHRPVDHRRDLRGLGHVDDGLRHPSTRLVADERRRLRHEGRVDVGQGEVAALLRQAKRGSAPDAPTGSGDQRHLAFETHALAPSVVEIGGRPALQHARVGRVPAVDSTYFR